MDRRKKQVLAWTLVGVQLLLLAALVWLPGPRAWSAPGWLTAVAVTASPRRFCWP